MQGGAVSIVVPLITGGLLDDFFGLPFLGKDLFTRKWAVYEDRGLVKGPRLFGCDRSSMSACRRLSILRVDGRMWRSLFR
jgi:hypothetical protein